MKAFVFVNDNGAAFSRYKKNEIPAQFVYGVSKLEKMGFEVMVGRGNLLNDLISFFNTKIFFSRLLFTILLVETSSKCIICNSGLYTLFIPTFLNCKYKISSSK